MIAKAGAADARRESSPLVSIVTPAYNQASFLRDTIESVLGQDYPRIEYRVLDDGSTDATPAVIAGYTGRLQAERHANRGQAATINEGWHRAQGDIFAWLNSDDTLLPGAVTRAVDYLRRHPEVDIVYGDSLFTDGGGAPLGRSQSHGAFDYHRFVLSCVNPIPQPSAFLRRSVFDSIGELDTHYRYFLDWDYWLRAGQRFRIAYFPELLSTYRLHPESNTVSQSARVAPELEHMYQAYFARADIPADLRSRQNQAMANMYFTSGGYYLNGGDAASAAAMGRQALRAFPPLLCRPAMLHRLAYCMAGQTRLYRGARALYRRLRRFRRVDRTMGDTRIPVSLVIPVRNEEYSLPALLRSIQEQIHPPDEIVVVDGGSTDGTVEVIRRLTASDRRFKVIEAGNATPGRGRNVGIEEATHDWIALTDAGIRLDPAWLAELIYIVQQDPEVDIVFGNYEPVIDSALERYAALVYLPARTARPTGYTRNPFIASSLLRRESWRQAGGFPDLRAAEDLIFMERLNTLGCKVAWAPKATVFWQMQGTLAGTFRRFALYSRHNVWAGRQRHWHYGVARQYAVIIACLILAVVHSAWWLLGPALWLPARLGKSLWLHREGRGLLWLLNPVQFVACAIILLTIDLATFTGWLQAWLQRPPR